MAFGGDWTRADEPQPSDRDRAGTRKDSGKWVAPYSRLAADYDRLIGDALYPTVRRSFESCVRELGLRFGSLADIGCGTGRFLRDMLGCGVPLIGVDRSSQMLRIAARRLRGGRVLLLRQDIRHLQLPRPVDLITCNGDTLNYLVTPGDLALTLLHCRENLRPEGHLVGDLLCGHPTNRDPSLTDVREGADGRLSLWRSRTDKALRMTRVEIDFGCADTNGKTRWAREIHLQRWHTPSVLEEAVKLAGLQLVLAKPLMVERDRRKPAAWIKIVLRRASVQR